MPKTTNQNLVSPSGIYLKRQVRLLDGRNIKVSIHKPFSIKGDMRTFTWDFSWMKYDNKWTSLLYHSLLKLLQTHSLSYANAVADCSRRMFNHALFVKCDVPLAL